VHIIYKLWLDRQTVADVYSNPAVAGYFVVLIASKTQLQSTQLQSTHFLKKYKYLGASNLKILCKLFVTKSWIQLFDYLSYRYNLCTYTICADLCTYNICTDICTYNICTHFDSFEINDLFSFEICFLTWNLSEKLCAGIQTVIKQIYTGILY